jgi:hypothetical protein
MKEKIWLNYLYLSGRELLNSTKEMIQEFDVRYL